MRLRQSHVGPPLGLLILAIALYILWQVRQLLLLVFAAIVLALALHLQALALQRLGLRRRWSRPASLAILLTFSIGFLWLIVPPVVLQLQQLARVLPQGLRELETWLDEAMRLLPIEDLPEQINLAQVLEQLQPFVLEVLGRPLMFVSVPLAAALNLLIILVLAVMFWADPAAYRQALVRLFPKFYRPRIDTVLAICEAALCTWLTSIVLQMLVVAILCGLGLWLLGVRFALAQGLLAGLLTFVPLLGPMLSVIPPLLTSLERPGIAIAVIMLYALVHWVVVNYGLQRWLHLRTAVLPGMILLMELLLARLFGLSGLILAFPLTVVGQVWVKTILIQDVLNAWQRDRPASEPAIAPNDLDDLSEDPPPPLAEVPTADSSFSDPSS